MLLSNSELLDSLNINKSNHLLAILNDYGNLIEYSLNIKLNEKDLNSYLISKEEHTIRNHQAPNKSENNESKNEDMEREEPTAGVKDGEEYMKSKQLIKLTEQSIECKLLGIDLLRTLCSLLKTGN